MATEKVSVSLDAELLAEARERSRRGTFSSYLNEALRRAVLADRHAEYLDQLDATFGPVPEDEQAAADRWWNDMKAAI